jgi:hypothetical protein
MKKIISMIIIAGIFVGTIAFGAATLLNGATATGAGNSLFVDRATDHSVVATFINTSTMVLALEASDTGAAPWLELGAYTIDSGDITNGAVRFNVTGRLTDYVRPNITTLTGGGATVTVTVLSD